VPVGEKLWNEGKNRGSFSFGVLHPVPAPDRARIWAYLVFLFYVGGLVILCDLVLLFREFVL
jgi:hypothetical protein